MATGPAALKCGDTESFTSPSITVEFRLRQPGHRALQLLREPLVDENQRMMRRLGAAVGMLVVAGLALTLMWRVYLHHQRAEDREEPTVVSLPHAAAFGAITSPEVS